MTKQSLSRHFKTSRDLIRLAVMLYVCFPLSLGNVEDLLHERGVEASLTQNCHSLYRTWITRGERVMRKLQWTNEG